MIKYCTGHLKINFLAFPQDLTAHVRRFYGCRGGKRMSAIVYREFFLNILRLRTVCMREIFETAQSSVRRTIVRVGAQRGELDVQGQRTAHLFPFLDGTGYLCSL